MANYAKTNIGNEGRVELHETLALTGAEISINKLPAGDWLRISPAGKRQFFTSEDSELTYICIQVKENSLEGFSMDDGVIY